MNKMVAQTNLLEASTIVELDLSECAFILPVAELAQLDGVPPALAAARIVITQLINTHFGDGMDRHDGQLWAGWQEVLLASDQCFTLTTGQIDWLMAILEKNDIKLPAGMAQWREALIDHLRTITNRPNRITNGDARAHSERRVEE